MPTPFYHLGVAFELIQRYPAAKELQEEAGSFLLGNTAPDVQVISGQTREATHFFSVPIADGAHAPWEKLLEQHPSLADHEEDDSSKIIFLAGYLCHLLADWIWVRSIFQPYFGPGQGWATFSLRLYLHNVLRANMDLEAIDGLPADTGDMLTNTHVNDWLPFVSEAHLNEWQQYLVHQLQPGSSVETVDVFAARHGTDPGEFGTIVISETFLQEKIFTHMPRARLTEYRSRVIKSSLALLEKYFEGTDTTAALTDQQ